MAVANLRRLRNRTKVNVTRNAMQHVRYCSYERGTGQERGAWHGPSGRETVEQVEAWAMREAREHTYLYSLVLSVREGLELGPDEFAGVMRADGLFADWRSIDHTDTPNHHAHVLSFSDKWIGSGELGAWQQATCARLTALEQQHELAGQERAPVAEQALMRGEGLEL
jgi:hypothetical protein